MDDMVDNNPHTYAFIHYIYTHTYTAVPLMQESAFLFKGQMKQNEEGNKLQLSCIKLRDKKIPKEMERQSCSHDLWPKSLPNLGLLICFLQIPTVMITHETKAFVSKCMKASEGDIYNIYQFWGPCSSVQWYGTSLRRQENSVFNLKCACDTSG